MEYFFILGSNPALSIAELSAIFEGELHNAEMSDDGSVLIFSSEKIADIAPFIKVLGGTIKIGEVLDSQDEPQPDIQKILDLVAKRIDSSTAAGKFPFGFSFYGRINGDGKRIGMQTKDFLKEKGISSRWVTSRERQLSSVVVETNKLSSKGIEIAFIKAGKKLFYGRTLSVQPFRELSFRDYGRPARDDRSGMLPPKLAQIMINLSGASKDAAILDPFCGSGTILSEAMLMGYDEISGSDLSSKAIADTKMNCSWVKEKFKLDGGLPALRQADAGTLSKLHKNSTFDAIITEPFLGPQRGRHDAAQTAQELDALYSKAFAEFEKILKPTGRIVMVWPIIRGQNGEKRLNPDLHGFKILPLLPNELILKQARLTDRGTIVYGREGQKVWREIVLLAMR